MPNIISHLVKNIDAFSNKLDEKKTLKDAPPWEIYEQKFKVYDKTTDSLYESTMSKVTESVCKLNRQYAISGTVTVYDWLVMQELEQKATVYDGLRGWCNTKTSPDWLDVERTWNAVEGWLALEILVPYGDL